MNENNIFIKKYQNRSIKLSKRGFNLQLSVSYPSLIRVIFPPFQINNPNFAFRNRGNKAEANSDYFASERLIYFKISIKIYWPNNQ